MAVLENDIKLIEEQAQIISNNIGVAGSWGANKVAPTGLYDLYNTFQYVTKGLEEWAEGAKIGADVQQSLTLLVDCFYSMIKNTEKLKDEVDTFITVQKTINQ